MNLLNDCCMYNENNVFGLYISLDDSNYEIIARLIAMEEKIPIGIASKPQRYKNKLENAKLNEYYSEEYDLIEKQLKKREDGLEKLRKNNDMMTISTARRCATSGQSSTRPCQCVRRASWSSPRRTGFGQTSAELSSSVSRKSAGPATATGR